MGTLKIGWGIRDISTDLPVMIPGQAHCRVSKGIEDRIYATALVISDGTDDAIFLCVETVCMRCGLLDEIRANVRSMQPGIPAEKILASATHTHEAPSHNYMDYLREEVPHPGIEIASSDDYRHFLARQAAEAVCEAWAQRAESGVGYGYGYAAVARSRRVVYFDNLSQRPGAASEAVFAINGHAAMYGETADDQFSHYEAGTHAFMDVLFTFDKDSRLTGAIVNVPCPSQNTELSERISGDYWSDTRRAIQAKFGNIFVLPQCAAAGDLAPRNLHYKAAQRRRFQLKYGFSGTQTNVGEDLDLERCERKDIAQRITDGFSEIYDWAKTDIRWDLPVRHEVKTIQLSRRMITEEEYQADLAYYNQQIRKPFKTEGDPHELLFNNSILRYSHFRSKRIIERYEQQKVNPTVPMELHCIRIGNIAFASNQFELYMDYQHRIQARSPFEQTFIVQLAGQPGDEGGTYLCTERGFEGRGYSASRYCNVVSPEGGQQLVEETLKLLETLK